MQLSSRISIWISTMVWTMNLNSPLVSASRWEYSVRVLLPILAGTFVCLVVLQRCLLSCSSGSWLYWIVVWTFCCNLTLLLLWLDNPYSLLAIHSKSHHSALLLSTSFSWFSLYKCCFITQKCSNQRKNKNIKSQGWRAQLKQTLFTKMVTFKWNSIKLWK